MHTRDRHVRLPAHGTTFISACPPPHSTLVDSWPWRCRAGRRTLPGLHLAPRPRGRASAPPHHHPLRPSERMKLKKKLNGLASAQLHLATMKAPFPCRVFPLICFQVLLGIEPLAACLLGVRSQKVSKEDRRAGRRGPGPAFQRPACPAHAAGPVWGRAPSPLSFRGRLNL